MDQPNSNQMPIGRTVPAQRRSQESQNTQIPKKVAFEWPIGYGNNMARKFNQQQKQKLWQMVSKQDTQLFDNFHPYGVVFFSNEITVRQNIQLFPYDVIQMLRWQSWTVTVNNEDDCFNWPRRFAMIKECQVDRLQFRISQHILDSLLWKSIEPIDFPDLTCLELYQCGVINIEPLAYLNAPKLKRINLIYNYVFQYKVLHKMQSPLKSLYLINKNQNEAFPSLLQTTCVNLQNYSRWNFQLEDLKLEKHYYNSVVMDDLSFLAKSKPNPSNAMFKVGICRQSRVPQKKLIKRYKQQTSIKFEIFVEFNQDLNPQNLELYQVRQ